MRAHCIAAVVIYCFAFSAFAGGTNYQSPVDGKSYRSEWRTYQPTTNTPPSRVQKQVVHMLSTQDEFSRNIDVSELADFIRKTEEAVDSFLVATNGQFELVVQTKLTKDKKPFFDVASQGDVSQDVLQKIYDAFARLPDYRSRKDDLKYEVQFTIAKKPSDEQSQTPKTLRIDRQKSGNTGSGVAALATNVVADFYRLKYSPSAEFRVTSSQPIAIFVLATGVQIRTDSGWQVFSEEPRNDIWRLNAGIAREMFVERPPKETQQVWRAYVRYSSEMEGTPLLKAQLQEAWKIRSFTNWTGQAWGGGRFAGRNELFSEEFSE